MGRSGSGSGENQVTDELARAPVEGDDDTSRLRLGGMVGAQADLRDAMKRRQDKVSGSAGLRRVKAKTVIFRLRRAASEHDGHGRGTKAGEPGEKNGDILGSRRIGQRVGRPGPAGTARTTTAPSGWAWCSR